MRALNARLSSLATWPEMLPHLEAFLLTRAARSTARAETGAGRGVEAAADWLLTAPAGLALAALADYACLSPHQFTRQFEQRLGGAGPAQRLGQVGFAQGTGQQLQQTQVFIGAGGSANTLVYPVYSSTGFRSTFSRFII